ncbi:hypothetical protein EDC04DRAFT_2938963 [Pisolithus marmoratus]|nr:hypothetical protein EDC04DRAFT_2938963 [Pisolithus marmoratus]
MYNRCLLCTILTRITPRRSAAATSLSSSSMKPIDPITSVVVKEREPNDMTKESQQKLFMSFGRLERSRALAPGQNPIRKAMQKGEVLRKTLEMYPAKMTDTKANRRQLLVCTTTTVAIALYLHIVPGLRFAGLDGVASSCSYALDERERERARSMTHDLVYEESLESGEENAYDDTGA